MVNDYHIAAMGWVSEADLKKIAEYSLRINELLTNYLKELNVELVDFKLEFGKTADGTWCWQMKFPRTPAASGTA